MSTLISPIVSEPGTIRPPVSVVILTRDEESALPECLSSCQWCDDVHVLDSGSTDRTCEIARQMGAQVHVHKFQSFGDQRNWAIDKIVCKHPWQFHLDADERMTPQLVKEMVSVLGPTGGATTAAAFFVPSMTIFLGSWIRRSSGYPAYQVRLLRTGKCRFVDFGHGQREQCDEEVGRLKSPYIHLAFIKGLRGWLNKHNSYSSKEAAEAQKLREAGRLHLSELFSLDTTVRRRALKDLSYFIRGRSLLRFFHSFVIKGGFLDGAAGFHFCLMMAHYEYWIELKIRERERPWQERTARLVDRLLEERPADALANPTDPPSLVDVLIPTFNEADHITEVVTNAQKLGPVYVLDSFSTDGTQELARKAGAMVIEHRFVNYSQQKNWALENLPFGGKWIFILDADERITMDLRNEILKKTSAESPISGYYVNRLLIFMGSRVRHGGLYPSWNLRLFRNGEARYEDRDVHEHMVCSGPTAYLREEMLHIRRESVSQYIEKHIRYADMESNEWVKWRSGGSKVAGADELFVGHLRYRQWIRRHVWPRLPGRPFWRFSFMYFARLGFLDGAAGWHLARLMFCYEYMISLMFASKMGKLQAVEIAGSVSKPTILAPAQAGSSK